MLTTDATGNVFVGSNADDTFTGSEANLENASHILVDGSSTDNDVLNITGTAFSNDISTSDDVIRGIENVNVSFDTLTDGTFTATGIGSASTITIANTRDASTAAMTVNNVADGSTVAAGAGVNSITATAVLDADMTVNGVAATTLASGTVSGEGNVVVTADSAATVTGVSAAAGTTTINSTGATTVNATGDTINVTAAAATSVVLTGVGTDVATVASDGATTINSANAVETINLSGVSAALTATLTGNTGTDTVGLTGDQSVTLVGDDSFFNNLIVTDATTAGTTTVTIDNGTGAGDIATGTLNLDTIAVDSIVLNDAVAAGGVTINVAPDANVTIGTNPGNTVTFDVDDNTTTDVNSTLDLTLTTDVTSTIANAAAGTDDIQTLNITTAVAQTGLDIQAGAATAVTLDTSAAVSMSNTAAVAEIQTLDFSVLTVDAAGGGTMVVGGVNVTLANNDAPAAIGAAVSAALNGQSLTLPSTGTNTVTATDDGNGVVTVTFTQAVGSVAAITVNDAAITFTDAFLAGTPDTYAAQGTTTEVTAGVDFAVDSTVDTFNASASTGAITIATGANFNDLTLGSGNDVVTAHAGAIVATGLGNDNITLNALGDADGVSLASTAVIAGGDGTDTLTIGGDVDISAGTVSGIDILALGANGFTATALQLTGEDFVVSGTGTITVSEIAASVNLSSFAFASTAQTVIDAATNIAGTVGGATPVAITGSMNVDTITGRTGADTLLAMGGNDVVDGRQGNDYIDGGAGNDQLTGGDGADTILGGEGNDTITGSAGNDELTGGAGEDDFVFTAGGGIDTITDFVSGTDHLDVTTGIIDAVVAETVVTSARTQDTMADGDIFYISTDGTAASVTTSGTATLDVADLTASTLTDLATFLSEAYATANNATEDALFVINWAGNDNSYVYDFTDAGGNTTVEAAEITLVGIVDNGGTILTTGDVI